MPIKRDKYPPNWEYISLHVRFVIANNHCQFCGVSQGAPLPGKSSRVVLTVAHLDHNESNNDFTNLKALCQKCHFAHDRIDNLKRRLINRKQRFS